MDRFSEMEIFVRVMEAGGFTEAARRAEMSKSAVSKQISALENRLGVRLLNRTTRRVTPTDIGLAFYDRAVRALAEADEADALAASLQAAPRGELRVSAPHSFGLRRLAPLLPEFLARHSEVSVHLSLEDRFVELVAEGFDLAIRIGQLADSALKARRIADVAMHMIAAPAYLAQRGAPATIDDLIDHDLLHYSYLASGRSWRLRDGAAERTVRVGGRLTVNSGDALLQAVERGLGVALLPGFICDESLSAGRVVEVLPKAAPAPLSVHAVTPPGRFPSPKVRAFVDHLAASLRREPTATAAAAAAE